MGVTVPLKVKVGEYDAVNVSVTERVLVKLALAV